MRFDEHSAAVFVVHDVLAVQSVPLCPKNRARLLTLAIVVIRL
jgi:hypothetical protein